MGSWTSQDSSPSGSMPIAISFERSSNIYSTHLQYMSTSPHLKQVLFSISISSSTASAVLLDPKNYFHHRADIEVSGVDLDWLVRVSHPVRGCHHVRTIVVGLEAT